MWNMIHDYLPRRKISLFTCLSMSFAMRRHSERASYYTTMSKRSWLSLANQSRESLLSINNLYVEPLSTAKQPVCLLSEVSGIFIYIYVYICCNRLNISHGVRFKGRQHWEIREEISLSQTQTAGNGESWLEILGRPHTFRNLARKPSGNASMSAAITIQRRARRFLAPKTKVLRRKLHGGFRSGKKKSKTVAENPGSTSSESTRSPRIVGLRLVKTEAKYKPDIYTCRIVTVFYHSAVVIYIGNNFIL